MDNLSLNLDTSNEPAFLRVFAPNRFPQDSTVNGIHDCMINPRMPNIGRDKKVADKVFGDYFPMEFDINIQTGQISNWTKDLFAVMDIKVVDMGVYSILNAAGETLLSLKYSSVPSLLEIDDENNGDNIYISTDGEGYIQNWKPKAICELIDFIKERERIYS